MRRAQGSLPFIALLALASPSEIKAEDAAADDWTSFPDQLRLILPEKSKLSYGNTTADSKIAEFIPENQSVEEWTDMMTVIIARRKEVATIDDFFASMTETFKEGCDVETFAPKIERFIDNGYPGGIQFIVCGQTRRFGKGEVVLYKAILCSAAIFQVQRAWRFPPAARSIDLPITKEMIDGAMARLDVVHVCERPAPGRGCSPSAGR